MTLPAYAFVGMKSPQALFVDLTPVDSLPNLALVSAASLTVKLPDETHATWGVTLSNQTTTTLRLTHVWAADGSDLVASGDYYVEPILTLIGGATWPCKLRSLPVRERL